MTHSHSQLMNNDIWITGHICGQVLGGGPRSSSYTASCYLQSRAGTLCALSLGWRHPPTLKWPEPEPLQTNSAELSREGVLTSQPVLDREETNGKVGSNYLKLKRQAELFLILEITYRILPEANIYMKSRFQEMTLELRFEGRVPPKI